MKRLIALLFLVCGVTGCFNVPCVTSDGNIVVGLNAKGHYDLSPQMGDKKEFGQQEIYLINCQKYIQDKKKKNPNKLFSMRRITGGGGFKTSADISPDGKRLCYVVMGKVISFVVSDSDGSNANTILSGPNLLFFPAWSADNLYVAFHLNTLVTPFNPDPEKKKGRPKKELWVIDPSDGKTQKIESAPVFWRPLWLPNSHSIVRVDGDKKEGVVFKGSLIAQEIGSGKERFLGRGYFCDSEYILFDWVCDSDGKVYYTSLAPGEDIEGKKIGADVYPEYVIASTAWDAKAWVKVEGRPYSLSISPDGRFLCFCVERVENKILKRLIFTYDVSNGRLKEIANNDGKSGVNFAATFWVSPSVLGYICLQSADKINDNEIRLFDMNDMKGVSIPISKIYKYRNVLRSKE